MQKLLTLSELAKWLKLSERSIHRLKDNGEIPFLKVGGVYRFDTDAIQKWIDEGGTRGKDER